MKKHYKLIIKYEKLEKFCEENNFIIITDDMLRERNIYKNIVYNTKENFVGEKVYPDGMPLMMSKIVWEKLVTLNEKLIEYGLSICIYDAYRPVGIQKIFWQEFYNKYGYYDEKLVANPNKYGTHNITMNAIDIIPVTIDGMKIEMPCEFDDFSGKSNVNFNECSDIEKKNRDLLIKLANQCGLIVNDGEWWHFYDSSLKEMGMSYDYTKSDFIPKNEEEVFVLEVGGNL